MNIFKKFTKKSHSWYDKLPTPFFVDKEHEKFLKKGESGRIVFAGKFTKEFEDRVMGTKGNATMSITIPEAWVESVSSMIRNENFKGRLAYVTPDECSQDIIIICMPDGDFLKKYAKVVKD